MILLEARRLILGYGDKIVVRDVNLEIRQGEIATIIGPNGSGKSTLIKALSRCLKPRQGEVLFANQNIFCINTKQIARKMAVLPQVKQVPNDFTVETLVSYGRYPHQRFGRNLTREDQEIIKWALQKTDTEKLRFRSVETLSGGERQRAWLAMCLAQKPQIIILDEPTTFLDISYQLEILDLVKELNEELGLTIVMVLHDINQAARYSHNIFVVKDGKVHSSGTSHQLLDQKFFQEVFSIEADVYVDEKNHCPYFIAQKVMKTH